MWPVGEQRAYLLHRIRLHADSEGSTDCDPAGRWEKPTTYAVMTAGLKKASKVEPSMDAAVAWADANPDKKGRTREVVARPGKNGRCQRLPTGRSYCPVVQWCARGRAEHGMTQPQRERTTI